MGSFSVLHENFIWSLLLKIYIVLSSAPLEYGMILWDTSSAAYSNIIERVQRKFLWSVAFISNIPCPPHGYTPIRLTLAFDTLANRRYKANISFFQTFLLTKSIFQLSHHKLTSIPTCNTSSHISFLIPFLLLIMAQILL